MLGRSLALPMRGMPPSAAIAVAKLGSARTYFSRPVPGLSVADAATLFLSPRLRDRQNVPTGMVLTEFEKQAAGAARRQGFLWSRHNCGQSAADTHFKFCCNALLPYLAAGRDASEIIVDVRPVGGMGKVKRDGAIDSVLRAFQGVLAGRPGVQVINSDSITAQRERTSTGSVDGPNTGRAADTQLGDSFTVCTHGRAEGLALAGELAEAYRRVLGQPSAEMRAEEAAARAADRVRRKSALMVRGLTRLVADPLAVKNLRVKAGAVDGFVAALKAGTQDIVPPK